MFYFLVDHFLSFLRKYFGKETSYFEIKNDFNYQIEKTYRIYIKKNYLKYTNEIDKTLGFFNADLISINERDSFLTSNRKQLVLTFKRKGFDTNTGSPYIKFEDISELDIMKAELLG